MALPSSPWMLGSVAGSARAWLPLLTLPPAAPVLVPGHPCNGINPRAGPPTLLRALSGSHETGQDLGHLGFHSPQLMEVSLAWLGH